MIIESKFKPWPGIANRHLQTLAGPLLISTRYQPNRWQVIDLPDDDFLEFAWFGKEDSPTLVISHGLEGSYQSHYIQRLIAKFLKHQWCVVVAHFRSCGRNLNRSMSTYHSGSSDELGFAIKVIKNQTQHPVYAVGFSLGGNVLLKWLGENPEQTDIKKAMAVSVPFKLSTCATAISQGMSRIYQKHLIDSLKLKMQQKLSENLPGPQLSSSVDLSAIKNFWQFDHYVTAPLSGFESADDYYQKASSYQFISKIQTPTLLLQSLDDPFMTEEVIPEREQLGPGLILELSRYGGHVGFLDHLNVFSKDCFLARRVFDYFSFDSRSDSH
ncbi:hydrolase [Pleionea sediminis]|uniref:hydrolase n=1 Tax=Pleionea sediminis TaxID=2569479 RepID=UPI0011855B5D|nr:hydrolase [Pleionea sediminis]